GAVVGHAPVEELVAALPRGVVAVDDVHVPAHRVDRQRVDAAQDRVDADEVVADALLARHGGRVEGDPVRLPVEAPGLPGVGRAGSGATTICGWSAFPATWLVSGPGDALHSHAAAFVGSRVEPLTMLAIEAAKSETRKVPWMVPPRPYATVWLHGQLIVPV